MMFQLRRLASGAALLALAVFAAAAPKPPVADAASVQKQRELIATLR